jgi:crotonobetainyl-CoA:carnitine CoA-transferase CaiB-like acyl-CoA transferase
MMESFSISDGVACAGALGGVLVMLLSTKFVNKKGYYANRREDAEAAEVRDKANEDWKRETEQRIVALEKAADLYRQPLDTMQKTLDRLEASVRQWLDIQIRQENRLTIIEAQRSASRSRHGEDSR